MLGQRFMFARILLMNTRHWSNAGLMLVQRRRQWANNKPALNMTQAEYQTTIDYGGIFNAVLMLAHRLRRWPSIKPALNIELYLMLV